MLSLNEMHDRYYYDAGVLYYKRDISSRARKGQPAGGVGSNGYWEIRYNGKKYMYHRVIYAMHHNIQLKQMDGLEIDHIDNGQIIILTTLD